MMVERLRERGYLPPTVAEAFERVRRDALFPNALSAHAELDLPFPVSPGSVSFSPRTAALLLAHLDVQPGHRVLIAACDPFLAAAASHLAGQNGEVVLACGNAALAQQLGERLPQAHTGGPIRCTNRIPWKENHYDRILLPEEEAVLPMSARVSLRDWGAILCRIPRRSQMDLVRIVRVGDDYAEMMLGDLLPSREPMGSEAILLADLDELDEEETDAWPIRRLLTLEEAWRHAWAGTQVSPEEEAFAEAVDETWRPEPENGATRDEWTLARRFFHLGYITLLAGDLEAAEEAFSASLNVAESAEGHTFLAWVWSFRGEFEEAIRQCKEAIRVDPEFGNPYNDIGAYYLELNAPERAEPWLRRAMRAPRYSARAYPHANLARARIMQGDLPGARQALLKAIELDPTYLPAWYLLDELEDDDW